MIHKWSSGGIRVDDAYAKNPVVFNGKSGNLSTSMRGGVIASLVWHVKGGSMIIQIVFMWTKKKL